MKRKLGINIDGVIRDYLTKFEQVYIQTYINNESLVETNGMELKVLTDEEEDAKNQMIRNKIDEMITKPIDSFDLMNHYKFEDGVNYLGMEKTAEELFEEFLYEIKAFHIFGQADQYPWAVDEAHRLQQFGQD